MRIIGRLAGYGALLVVVFLGSWAAAGALVPEELSRSWSEDQGHDEPMDPDPTSPHQMSDEHEGGPADDH